MPGENSKQKAGRWLPAFCFAFFLGFLPMERSEAVTPLFAQQSKPGRVFTNDNLSAPISSADAPGSLKTGSRVPAPPDRGAPYVPTPMSIVDRMLETAKVTSADTVYDLGSGDGRIVLRAAQRFGAHAVGVEIDKGLVDESKDKAKEMKVEDKATFVAGDVFQTDVSSANVVAMYLDPEMLEKLRPMLEQQLHSGARVVSYQFPIPGWQAASTENVISGTHPVYFYRIPEAFRKASKVEPAP